MALYLIEEAPPGAALCEADAGTRTPDPFITSEVLYQLSYVGATRMLARRQPLVAARQPALARIAIATARVQLRQQRLAVLLAERRADAADLEQRLRRCAGVARSTSSSTALEATVYAGLPSARS